MKAHHQQWNDEVTSRIVEWMLEQAPYIWKKKRFQRGKPRCNPVHSLYIAFSPNSITKPFFCHFCLCTIDVCNLMRLLYDKCCVSLRAYLPSPQASQRSKATSARLNGWAALWKTVAVLIHKPPSLCSQLLLQGSSLRLLYWIQNEGFQNRQ